MLCIKITCDLCENLPEKLKQEGLNPKLPWLYGFELDFRFR
jgi:hypothetical protein